LDFGISFDCVGSKIDFARNPTTIRRTALVATVVKIVPQFMVAPVLRVLGERSLMMASTPVGPTRHGHEVFVKARDAGASRRRVEAESTAEGHAARRNGEVFRRFLKRQRDRSRWGLRIEVGGRSLVWG
jgi:hypothetical protein